MPGTVTRSRAAEPDTGITVLVPLRQPQSLNLHDTDITDGALPVLDQLPALQQAFLWSTAATTEATASRDYARIETGFTPPPISKTAPDPEPVNKD